MRRWVEAAFYLGAAWSLLVVSLVVAGSDWALARAAGGQFGSFPVWLRVLYLFNVALIGFEIRVFATNKAKYYSAFLYLNIASAVANALSRSPPERFNALAAAAMALGFWHWRRRDRQREVGPAA